MSAGVECLWRLSRHRAPCQRARRACQRPGLVGSWPLSPLMGQSSHTALPQAPSCGSKGWHRTPRLRAALLCAEAWTVTCAQPLLDLHAASGPYSTLLMPLLPALPMLCCARASSHGCRGSARQGHRSTVLLPQAAVAELQVLLVRHGVVHTYRSDSRDPPVCCRSSCGEWLKLQTAALKSKQGGALASPHASLWTSMAWGLWEGQTPTRSTCPRSGRPTRCPSRTVTTAHDSVSLGASARVAAAALPGHQQWAALGGPKPSAQTTLYPQAMLGLPHAQRACDSAP